MVSFSFWAIESTHWLFVLISHFPCSLCAFVFIFVCFSACFYVECLSLTEAVDKQPSITLKVYKLSNYQRWFFLRSTQADFASSSPPTSAAAAILSVCLSVLFLPVCISLWYFVCGQIKHKLNRLLLLPCILYQCASLSSCPSVCFVFLSVCLSVCLRQTVCLSVLSGLSSSTNWLAAHCPRLVPPASIHKLPTAADCLDTLSLPPIPALPCAQPGNILHTPQSSLCHLCRWCWIGLCRCPLLFSDSLL